MSLDWYDNFIDKVQGTPSWQPAQEQVRPPGTAVASPHPRESSKPALTRSRTGLDRAVHLPRLDPGQGGALGAHRGVQPVDGCRRRRSRDCQESRRDAAHGQPAVRSRDTLAVQQYRVLTIRVDSRRMDDVEDDSHLRRGMPGQSPISEPLLIAVTDPVRRPAVAHKIYGIPQTINSANYVYFLAFQELQRIHPRPGIKVEEMVTGGFASTLSKPWRLTRSPQRSC